MSDLLDVHPVIPIYQDSFHPSNSLFSHAYGWHELHLVIADRELRFLKLMHQPATLVACWHLVDFRFEAQR